MLSFVDRHWYIVVSSAYVPRPVPSGSTSSQSFVYKITSLGPRILPCGTPDVISDDEEDCPPTTAWILRPVK